MGKRKMAASMGRHLGQKCSCFYRNFPSRNSLYHHVNKLAAVKFSLLTKCYARPYEYYEIEDSEFRVLYIPGHSAEPARVKKNTRPAAQVLTPRANEMLPDQDWTSVWPTAETFKYSAVPLPLRQGLSKRSENEGIPLGKYGNTELMKIPNFLHLTPPHVQKHCQVLKNFCTDWPEGLETDERCDQHFPITVVTSDYVLDKSTPRDARARKVTLQIKLSDLELDDHGKDKMLKLVGDRYDGETDTLTITADRCPVKKQNYDYATYLLTVLYHESCKTEPWEEERTEVDMVEYEWDKHSSKNAIIETINNTKKLAEKSQSAEAEPQKPTLGKLLVSPEASAEDLLSSAEVAQYKEAWRSLHDEGENLQTLEKYRKATAKLLLGVEH